jgi:hypothetical protein
VRDQKLHQIELLLTWQLFQNQFAKRETLSLKVFVIVQISIEECARVRLGSHERKLSS